MLWREGEIDEPPERFTPSQKYTNAEPLRLLFCSFAPGTGNVNHFVPLLPAVGKNTNFTMHLYLDFHVTIIDNLSDLPEQTAVLSNSVWESFCKATKTGLCQGLRNETTPFAMVQCSCCKAWWHDRCVGATTGLWNDDKIEFTCCKLPREVTKYVSAVRS